MDTAAWHLRTLRTATAVFFFLLLYFALQSMFQMKALASGSVYYINNQTGSNCDNTSAGVSESAPWCDFTRVNGMTFGPGDRILLARGATWNQQMTINGSGSAANDLARADRMLQVTAARERLRRFRYIELRLSPSSG